MPASPDLALETRPELTPHAEHLAAAAKYFPAPEAAPFAWSAPTAAPASTAAPSAPNSDLRSPNSTSATAAAAAPAGPAIDQGLQAPPETAKSRAGWEELKRRAALERDSRHAAERRLAELESKLRAHATPASSSTASTSPATPATATAPTKRGAISAAVPGTTAPAPHSDPRPPLSAHAAAVTPGTTTTSDSTPASDSTPTAEDATRARIQELETTNQTLSERLRAIDLRAHPEFVAKYLEPANQARAALAAIAQTDGIALDVDALLARKGRAFNTEVSAVLESLTPYARVQFQTALNGYIASDLGAQQALAQADDFLATARQANGARSREAFDKIGQTYQGAFLPAAIDDRMPDAEKADATQYNADLAALSRRAETYAFGELDATRAADLAHKAALFEFTMTRALPRINSIFERTLAARDTRIAELEAQSRALTAASPTLDPGAGPTRPDAAPATAESHLDAARRYQWSL